MVGIFLIVLVGIVIYIAIKVNGRVYRATEHLPRSKKILFRTLSLTFTYGIGIIGGEGFGLPVPLIGALIFYNGPKYYWMTALVPAMIWFFIFLIWQFVSTTTNYEKSS
jgi:hypothetical protein